jgi:ankyrin repeat protein
VAALLAKRFGCDPTAGDAEGLTPCHNACLGGHSACVLQLVASGADASAGDRDGLRPLHAACLKGQVHHIRNRDMFFCCKKAVYSSTKIK